jgi:hypothetical protein
MVLTVELASVDRAGTSRTVWKGGFCGPDRRFLDGLRTAPIAARRFQPVDASEVDVRRPYRRHSCGCHPYKPTTPSGSAGEAPLSRTMSIETAAPSGCASAAGSHGSMERHGRIRADELSLSAQSGNVQLTCYWRRAGVAAATGCRPALCANAVFRYCGGAVGSCTFASASAIGCLRFVQERASRRRGPSKP